MDTLDIRQGSLVRYKHAPARVTQTGERIEVELPDGERVRVRPKDVDLLHPGPLSRLDELASQQGDVELAWEILCEDPQAMRNIAELAELIYGMYTPATAWSAWQWVEDGLYFRGTPAQIQVCSPEQVAAEKATRQAKQAEASAWAEFLERARAGNIDRKQDAAYLREVEDLALGRRKASRLLRELGHSEQQGVAHRLLLEWGYWEQTVVPYPTRFGLPVTPPVIDLPDLIDEPRLDLTHLPAYAIDDRDNQDPDDAISLAEYRVDEAGEFQSAFLWVHVADAAALVRPGSPADLEGRGRGATLYLPEGAAPMLPLQAIQHLGLGLQEFSPSLSFGIEIDAHGDIQDVHIQPARVRVQRLTYEQVEERLEEAPFASLYRIVQTYQARRQSNGALLIDLPEVIIRVNDGQVQIRPVLNLRSRDLVRESMLMAGEAAASFAITHQIPFPFATQPAPDQASLPVDRDSSMAARFATRRLLRPSQVSGQPGLHAGVGLPAYNRVTSPLRRYLDLVAHQQLRAHLLGQAGLTEAEMLERVGAAEAITGSVNQAEILSRRHWTLVYLMQNPGWQGEAVLVEKHGLRARLILPDLALEPQIQLKHDLPLDSRIMLRFRHANLPELEAYFEQA